MPYKRFMIPLVGFKCWANLVAVINNLIGTIPFK
jgi:hypothetical protein